MNDVVQGISSAVAPAGFVSACALAALGLDNQCARLAQRLREAAAARSGLPRGPERRALARRIAILGRRHVLAARALLFCYGALAALVACSLALAAPAALGVPREVAVLAFALGALQLGATAALAGLSAHLRLADGGPLPEWRALAREDPPSQPALHVAADA
jgi:uncharacterized protein DUF2721